MIGRPPRRVGGGARAALVAALICAAVPPSAALELDIERQGTGAGAELHATLRLASPPERVADAVLDFESQPERTPALRAVRRYLDAAGPDGRTIGVAYELVVAGRTVRYALLHRVSADGRSITWTLDPSRAHDVARVDGAFTLRAAGAGTELDYRSTLDTGMVLPDFVAELLTERSLRGYLRGVERRAAELASGPATDG